ncbi:Protein of unknown function, partial [Gryllus bimaculatus]
FLPQRLSPRLWTAMHGLVPAGAIWCLSSGRHMFGGKLATKTHPAREDHRHLPGETYTTLTGLMMLAYQRGALRSQGAGRRGGGGQGRGRCGGAAALQGAGHCGAASAAAR